MLVIKNLTKKFGGVVAIQNLSFQVEEMSIFGIIGPNGAGKSTLINLITGFDKPDCGNIVYNKIEINNYSISKRVSLGIVRTFQIPQFFPSLTVLENIMIPLLKNYDFNESTKLAIEIAERFFLIDELYKPAELLSVGKMKLLEIAKAYALKPKLLLIDEPFGGLSEDKIPGLIKQIKSLNEEGITIVLVEHVIKAVVALCSEILVLNFGEKLIQGKPKQVINNKKVIEAYLGQEFI